MKETVVLAFLFSLVIHHLTNFQNGNKEKITFNTSSISDVPYNEQLNLYNSNSNINTDVKHESHMKSTYLLNGEDVLTKNQLIFNKIIQPQLEYIIIRDYK